MKLSKKSIFFVCLSALFHASAVFAATTNVGGNTPTGEDRGTYLDKQAAALSKAIRESPNDKKRWASTTIYSSEKKAEELKMNLIAATGFKMALLPGPGHLVFERDGKRDAFQIGVPLGTKDNVCPEYFIQVLQAAPDFALFRKICPSYEYGFDGKKDHFHRGVEYLLYDSTTASIAVLWMNATSTKGDPSPAPQLEPQIRRNQNGYELDWQVSDPISKSKYRVHTKYVPEVIKGKPVLVCTDLMAPKEEAHAGNCEPGILPRIEK